MVHQATMINASATTYDESPCVVNITGSNIRVEYHYNKRIEAYTGKESAPGHYHLVSDSGPYVTGHATLHSENGLVFEGSWDEVSTRPGEAYSMYGLWKITLDEPKVSK